MTPTLRSGCRGDITLVTMCMFGILACSADPGYRGRTSDDWIAQLNGPSVLKRVDATLALAEILRINPDAPGVSSALVRALADSNDQVRVAAGIALEQPGINAANAVRGLVDMANDSAHAHVRAAAIRILGHIAVSTRATDIQPHLEAITNVLVRALADSSTAVRTASAVALERLSLHVQLQSPALAEALLRVARDPDRTLRTRALTILEHVALPDAMRRMVYLDALRDSASTVRVAAVQSSGNLQLLDGDMLTQVIASLADTSAAVRRASVVALGEREPANSEIVRVALRSATADADSAVRTEATHALSRFHERGGVDAAAREPTREERCRNLPPRTRGC